MHTVHTVCCVHMVHMDKRFTSHYGKKRTLSCKKKSCSIFEVARNKKGKLFLAILGYEYVNLVVDMRFTLYVTFHSHSDIFRTYKSP